MAQIKTKDVDELNNLFVRPEQVQGYPLKVNEQEKCLLKRPAVKLWANFHGGGVGP